jgi:hypothetical protein
MIKNAFAAVLIFVAAATFTKLVQAQTVLTPGTVTINTNDTSCHGLNFGGGSCYNGSVSCGSPIPDIDFTIGFSPASGPKKGTVVFFSDGDGNTVNFANYVTPYNNSGFQTAQVVWQSETGWEENGPLPTTIQAAACRPAGILNWFFNPANQHVYTTGGRCAQGDSAGSAAIGYAMAEYGASTYLDNVELMSGPVLSDIGQGCVPPFARPTICTDMFCLSGTEGGWPDSPEYLSQSTQIDAWTGVTNSQEACVTGNEVAGVDWTAMSIVDHSSQNNATFYYPTTNVTGWLCSDDQTNATQQCTQNATNQNNSAAEGYIFYQALHKALTPSLTVYRVDSCGTTGESVGSGYVPALSCGTGMDRIGMDMVRNCVRPQQ